MDGVRRFLTGNTASSDPPQPPPVVSISPLSLNTRPPTDNDPTNVTTVSPVSTTNPLSLKRDKQRLQDDDRPQHPSFRKESAQPTISPHNPSRISPPNPIPLAVDHRNFDENAHSTRDELLLSLLASEAVAECQGHEILSSERVEELKSEHQALSSRLAGLKKKLTLETKIRDAAVSLARVNAPSKNVSNEQVDSANSKVESVQKDVWQLSEQVNEIHRRLMEHRASVLSHSLKLLEKSHHSAQSPSMSGTSSPSALNSPADSKVLPVHTKFEHFFAGHSDAVIPEPRKKPPSRGDVTALEGKLSVVTRELTEANARQADLARELSSLKLEKEQLQATLEMQLRIAEEHTRPLENELHKYEGEVRELRTQKGALESLRVELEERKGQAESLRRQLEAADQRSGETSKANDKQVLLKEEEITKLRAEMDAALQAKDLELTNANIRFELETARWANELAPAEDASATLWAVVQEHDIPLPDDSDTTIPVLAESISFFIENTLDSVRELRESLRGQRELSNTIKESREEAGALRKEIQYLENQSREQSDRIAELIAQQTSASSTTVEYKGDAATLMATLAPVWAVLPSAEARAAKLGQNRFRATSPIQSPTGSPMKQSLSEMDVRSLKSLYDSTKIQSRPGTPGSPSMSGFTIEAFVSRVQSLIADDRALIERLVRFAQAHDLLKKNAERAQKLAMDTSAALETYQKQVKALEDRDLVRSDKNAELTDEVAQLQEAVDQLESERRELELQVDEQAETCRQLTAANSALSAQSLSLADEITAATNAVRKQMEAQLTDVEKKLAEANETVDAMKLSEETRQTQHIAFLEEFNAAQTENENLRAQLRKK